MKKIYHLNTCDTCQAILKEVQAEKKGADLQDIKTEKITPAQIDEMKKLSGSYESLFQIGGFKILRGFDEESIFTNRFAVATFEYRYLLAQNGYFFVFSDAGYASYQSSSGKYSHTYISGGTGLAFETKTGIFNISYGVGKRNDLKFDLRQSKIHIGFVSLF